MSTIKVGSAVYKDSDSCGHFKPSDDFYDMHPVIKLDILGDLIFDLQEEYKKAYQECYPKIERPAA